MLNVYVLLQYKASLRVTNGSRIVEEIHLTRSAYAVQIAGPAANQRDRHRIHGSDTGSLPGPDLTRAFRRREDEPRALLRVRPRRYS
jgi:hypothetical protein